MATIDGPDYQVGGPGRVVTATNTAKLVVFYGSYVIDTATNPIGPADVIRLLRVPVGYMPMFFAFKCDPLLATGTYKVGTDLGTDEDIRTDGAGVSASFNRYEYDLSAQFPTTAPLSVILTFTGASNFVQGAEMNCFCTAVRAS